MKCPQCKNEISEEVNFCPTCGMNLKYEIPKFCPECGCKTEEDTRFCPKCGADLYAPMLKMAEARQTPLPPNNNTHPRQEKLRTLQIFIAAGGVLAVLGCFLPASNIIGEKISLFDIMSYSRWGGPELHLFVSFTILSLFAVSIANALLIFLNKDTSWSILFSLIGIGIWLYINHKISHQISVNVTPYLGIGMFCIIIGHGTSFLAAVVDTILEA